MFDGFLNRSSCYLFSEIGCFDIVKSFKGEFFVYDVFIYGFIRIFIVVVMLMMRLGCEINVVIFIIVR